MAEKKSPFDFSNLKPYSPPSQEEQGFDFSNLKPYSPPVLDSTKEEDQKEIPWHELASASYNFYNKERGRVFRDFYEVDNLIKEGIIDKDSPAAKKAYDDVTKIFELDERWESKNRLEQPEWYRQKNIREKLLESSMAAETRPDMSESAPSTLGKVREAFTPVVGPTLRQRKQADWLRGDEPIEEAGWIEGFDLQNRGLIPSLIQKQGADYSGFGVFRDKLGVDKVTERDVETVFGENKWAERGAGAANAVIDTVDSVLSPLGIMTAGAGTVLPKASKAIHGAFALDMTRAVVEHTPEIAEVWRDPNSTELERWEALSGHALLATFAYLSGRGVVSNRGVSLKEIKTPQKAIQAAREMGIFDSAKRIAAERRGDPSQAKRGTLERLPDESAADFNKRVAEQQLLEIAQTGEAAPKEAIPVKDVPIKDVPIKETQLVEGGKASDGIVVRPNSPISDYRQRQIDLFKKELAEKGELTKPEVEPIDTSSLPTPKLKPIEQVDPLAAETVKSLKEIALKEDISLTGKRKKSEIIEAINQARAEKEFMKEAAGLMDESPAPSSPKREGFWSDELSPPDKIIREMKEQRDAEAPKELEGIQEAIFPEKKSESINLIERGREFAKGSAESARSQFLSEFRPVERMQEQIFERAAEGKAGELPTTDVAARFEALAGSSGQAEVVTRRFTRDLYENLLYDHAKNLKLDPKQLDGDFNTYLFLKRTRNRLVSDPNKKRVADFDISKVDRNLKTLNDKLGGDTMGVFDTMAQRFQSYADMSLRIQVESGRMSKELYNAIKKENDFYAPMLVKELGGWVDPKTGLPSKRNPLLDKANTKKAAIDSVRELTKKIEGMDVLREMEKPTEAMARQLYQSVILAQRNKAMLKLKEVADADSAGIFAKKLSKGESPEAGFGEVKVLENGKELRYSVPKDVADVIGGLGSLPQGKFWDTTRMLASPFKYGATTANIPFQFKNFFFSDLPSAALMSRYGLGMNYRGTNAGKQLLASIKDIGPFLFGDAGLVKSIYSAMSQGEGRSARLFDAEKLYEQAMEAGVMRSTSHKQVIDNFGQGRAMEYKLPDSDPRVLNTIGKITNVIEESFKIHGIQRALKLHGAKNVKELLERNPEAITEVRRMHGSPDFARFGSAMHFANILYIFSNARMQGAARSVSRLSANTPEGTAARARFTAAVGIPAATLWIWNQKNWNDEIDTVPDYDKRNNFIVFLPWKVKRTLRSGKVIEGQDYLRIPKREEVKYIANAVENSLDFAKNKDPESFGKIIEETAEDLFPLDMTGEGYERLWGLVPSHPFARAAVELLPEQGYDVWRRQPLLTDEMMRRLPEDRYRDDTSDLAKGIGTRMGVSPEKVERAADIAFAGLYRQFAPRNLPEGRPELFYKPPTKWLAKPFLSSGFRESPIEKARRERAGQLSLEGGSERFNVNSEASEFISTLRMSGISNEEIMAAAMSSYPMEQSPENRIMIQTVRRYLRQGPDATDPLPVQPKQRGIMMMEIIKSDPQKSDEKIKEWMESGEMTREVLRLNKGLRDTVEFYREKERLKK